MTHTLRHGDLDPEFADVFARNHAHLREQHSHTRTRAARVVLEAGLTSDDATYAATYAVARVLHASSDPDSDLTRRFPETTTLRATTASVSAFDPALEPILSDVSPERLRAIRLLVDLVWAGIAGTGAGLPVIEPSTLAAAFAVAEDGKYEGPGGSW